MQWLMNLYQKHKTFLRIIFQNFEKYEKKQEGSTLYRMDTSIVYIFDRQTLMRIMEYSKAGKKSGSRFENISIYFFH